VKTLIFENPYSLNNFQKNVAMFGLPLLTIIAISTACVDAAVKASINNTVEHGVNTECKTCPYTLCTNKAYYESDALVTVTCYTHGTVIDDDEYISF
jgi:hypothetical protein